jgi:NAD(P)-dependent dehydrogenase (short-subunit alcohol dehydrogenase family)
LGKLAGKVAVVTGGNSGIGLSAAEHFVAEGAFVYITGRRQRELDLAVAKIGNNVTAVRGDVTDLASLNSLYSRIGREKGHIDVLFANAGIGNQHSFLGEITEEQFDRTFDINVRGLLFTVQKALPLVRRGGSILLNASIASGKGIPRMSVYSASKAAIRSFARTWAMELRDREIRVNVISPGYTDTPIFDTGARTPEQVAQLKVAVAKTTPFGRLARPEEIARAAVFLASDDSSYVNGIDLAVDGGLAQI